MNYIYVSFIFLMFVSIKADEKNSTESLIELNSEENNSKLSEKRWTQDNLFKMTQPSFKGPMFVLGNGLLSKMMERAKEEKTWRDLIPMKTDFQQFFIKALRPKPIVDTASEAEKSAPNHGSGTEILGDLVVKGSETLSRALLTVLDVPKKAFGKLSEGTTQALNQLGAYIVGI